MLRTFSRGPLFTAALLASCIGGSPSTDDSDTDTDTDTDTEDTEEVVSCSAPIVGATTYCEFPSGRATLYEESWIVDVSTCQRTVQCDFGEVCFQEAGIAGGEATCRRSVDASQAAKPYYDFSCGTFSEYLRFPTMLEIDCRCRVTGDGQGGAGGTGNAMADPNDTDVSNGARPGGPIINCMESGAMADRSWPVAYGTGPNFNAWFQENSSGASWFSGTVDPVTREMFGIIRWSDPTHSKAGTLVAWDLDTGDRRVVSGIHPYEGSFGSGYDSPQPQGPFNFGNYPLVGANSLKFGPDGYLYSLGGGSGETPSDQREIVRIDPDTGERTLVWLAQRANQPDISATYGQCLRPEAYDNYQSVAINPHSLTLDPSGNFYMSYRGVREGDGIVRVSADGSTCTILSAWGGTGHNPGGGATPAPPPGPIGVNPAIQFPVEGMLFHDGRVYGVSNTNMFSWDPDTGDGSLVTYTNSTFQGIGVANVFWDPTREVIWAVGTDAPFVGAIVDPSTGRRESVFGDTGIDEYGDEAILRSVYGVSRGVGGPPSVLSNGNTLGKGAFVLDPDDNDIVYGVMKSGGLFKMELSTFNSYVMSW